jgi:hypothetical protein
MQGLGGEAFGQQPPSITPVAKPHDQPYRAGRVRV